MDDLNNGIDQNSNGQSAPTTTSSPSSFDERLPGSSTDPLSSTASTNAGNLAHGPDFVRDEDKIMLILAYFFPFIPFFTVKDNEYVLWHARQGLVNWILSVLISWTCIGAIFCIYVWIKGTIEALKPNRWEAPLVSTITNAIFKK